MRRDERIFAGGARIYGSARYARRHAFFSIADQAIRPPRGLKDGEVLDLGGKRVRRIDTPHVPHGWDAGLFYEETTGTLFAGDLFTLGGRHAAMTHADVVSPALEFEAAMPYTGITPNTQPTLERLAQLEPRTLALMHNSAFDGDCAAALNDLAKAYGARLESALQAPAPVTQI